jgi:UDP-N-acetylmuramate-alanine ligase
LPGQHCLGFPSLFSLVVFFKIQYLSSGEKTVMEKDRLLRIYEKLGPFLTDTGELFLIVSIETQTLLVCSNDTIVEQYGCSTSRFGIGNRENSLKTPLGLHRIREKFGNGAPAGRVFRDREDTGENWDHCQNGDNLILTRILRLEGLESGINRGPGVDSYERYIYIHGTGREDSIGIPLSHGCVCLRNLDVIRLFERVKEGTLVYIDPPPIVVWGRQCRDIHFTGIFGSGMSALAQYLRFRGISVTGSDRFHASEDTTSIRGSLEGLGCAIVPQDGSGINANTDVVCVSTAIEESNPDIAAARSRGLTIIHRSDLLAAVIAEKNTIAVAGTSGKSTVTAMIFEFLTACEKSPSLISGAGLRRLERQGLIGNAWSGGSDLLVVEADESDGTLVKYRPDAVVFLNISKDHKSPDEIKHLFEALATRTPWTASNADDPILRSLPATVRFGRNGSASWRPDREQLLPTSVKLFKNGIEYHLPLPGDHNLANLRAALCVCEQFGCDPTALADAVKNYEGVARRFTLTATTHGVHVIDDFAHNPAKIAAVVRAARGISEHIVAVYQPHGFGPTRFLKDEYITTFRTSFQKNDSVYLLPIYYAGGSAQQDISSEDIVSGLGTVSFHAQAVKSRDELLTKVKADAKSGDCVLLMGARDPSLPALARKIIDLFGGERGTS